MILMNSVEKDRQYLEAVIPELEAYLLSKELYWPTPARPGERLAAQFLRLTPGNLLLSEARLRASPGAQENGALLSRIDEISRRWRSHWLQKIEKEIPARLRLWKNYLHEAPEDKPGKSGYRYQVRLRAMLDLLLSELPAPSPEVENQLYALDQTLKAITHATEFVWESDLSGGFPEKNFWYLYRIL